MISDQTPEPSGTSMLDGSVAETMTVETLYESLRGDILSGHFRPGTVLSQVKLAESFGIGRSRLREALRMLQREGLVDAEYNRRVRVTALSTAELDQVYGRRMLLEAIAIRTSIPRFTDADIRELESLHASMIGFLPDPPAHMGEWERYHRSFHRLLVRYAGEHIVHDVHQLQDKSERYRALLGSRLVSAFSGAADEHGQLVELCKDRNAELAGKLIARHLGRSGQRLVTETDPAYDAVVIREALRVIGDAGL
jgi:DNA-binding GntR family transcriptional regulator